MQDHFPPLPSLAVHFGVLVVDGYGIRIRVHRRHLVIEDGIGRTRRQVRLARATSGIRRLVLLGHTGFLTLEALRWLADIGAALVQIDRDGRVLTTTASLGLDDPRLRRAQAAAATSPVGLEVSRAILRDKLNGQASVLATIEGSEEQRGAIAGWLQALEEAGSIDELRFAESQAAVAYWAAWENLPFPFARADAAKVPDHWRTFGRRSSLLASGPRMAVNPPNTILNYVYALLEAEARIGCLAMGLDPGLGIVHADQKARDSLALDVMEAVRPQVDGYLLDLMEGHAFSACDFHETRQGACRLLAPLTHHLAETSPAWGRALAPVIERVAQSLARPERRTDRIPTRLTQARRSAAKDTVRARPVASTRPQPLPPACRSCGVILEDHRRTHCDGCLPERLSELASRFNAAGPAALARTRAEGRDPLRQPETRERMRRKRLQRQTEQDAWQPSESDSLDPETFRREILPALRSVPVRRIAAATGLSRPYCSEVRRGVKVPHPRHWEALRSVLNA